MRVCTRTARRSLLTRGCAHSSLSVGRHGVLPEFETNAGNSENAVIDSEHTYWKLASSMGGFPVKHFFGHGASLRPSTGGQMLRRVADGAGAGADGARGDYSFGHRVHLYGQGLGTADLDYGKPSWLSRRVRKMREYFNVGARGGGGGGGARVVAPALGAGPAPLQLAQAASTEATAAAKELVMERIHALQHEVQAAAEQRVDPWAVMPGPVVLPRTPARG